MIVAAAVGACFGLGLWLVIAWQPVGRPGPDLLRQLARLTSPQPIPAAAPVRTGGYRLGLFARWIRPLMDECGEVLMRGLTLLGVRHERLANRLHAAGDPATIPQFLGQKLASALITFSFLPFCNGLGIRPFGPWPLWTWLAAGLAGFLLPDLMLSGQARAQRAALIGELPVVLDVLTLGISSGLGLQQALQEAAAHIEGHLASELRRALTNVTLENQDLITAMEAMAERVNLAEWQTVVAALRAAIDHGFPVAAALKQQAAWVRERQRLAVLERGQTATAKMVIPVGLLVLPAFFTVVLYPAAVQFLELGR